MPDKAHPLLRQFHWMVPILLSIRKKCSFPFSCAERRNDLHVLLLTRSVSSCPQSPLESNPPLSSNPSRVGPIKRVPIAPEEGLTHGLAPISRPPRLIDCPRVGSILAPRQPPNPVSGRARSELCNVSQVCFYEGLHPREVSGDGTVQHAHPRPLRPTVTNTVGVATPSSGR